MTEEQFLELKALLLMTNALLVKQMARGRVENYPELWSVVQKNLERIHSALRGGTKIEDLGDMQVDYP